jgi:hypothetical protein
MKVALVLTAFVAALVLAGCKASVPQESGFLSDYSKLQAKSKTSLTYVDNQKLGTYSKFIVDPVQLKFYNEKEAKKVTPEKLEKFGTLQTDFQNAMIQDLQAAGYEVVSTPGPDTARIRLAITDIKKGEPALNVLPQTALVGVGLGGATAEGEIVDSQTNQQVAAAIESQLGKRYSMGAFSAYGNAKQIVDDWAQRIVQRINYAHGKG